MNRLETPPFDFVATVYSLFYRGLVGVSSISMSGSATTDSFDPRTGAFGSDGDVLTNGKLSMSNTATVNGDATAASYNMSGSSQATGTMTLLTTPESFMQIKVPDLLPDLGAIALNGQSQTIVGPGSFRLSSLAITNSSSTLYVDNSAGPVTLYVLGKVSVSGGGKIQVADPDPERFAVYVASTQPVSVTGGGTGSRFYGVVYAPTSSLSVTGNGEFFGAFVGAATTANGSSRVHYDVALRPQ